MSQWVFEFSWLYCGYKGYIPVVCIPISVHIFCLQVIRMYYVHLSLPSST